MTRRSPRFLELAILTEASLGRLGVRVPAHVIDSAINAQLQHLAHVLQVADVEALDHMPHEVGNIVSATLVAITPTLRPASTR